MRLILVSVLGAVILMWVVIWARMARDYDCLGSYPAPWSATCD